MGRRQRRRRQATDAMQVDLLDDVPSADADPRADDAEPEVETPTRGERWVKAVGRVRPASAPDPSDEAALVEASVLDETTADDATSDDATSGHATSDDATHPPEAVVLSDPEGGEATEDGSGTASPQPVGPSRLRARNETARNHRSAGIRPAGQPLARARDLVEQGRVQEATELYLGILTVNPSNMKAHNNLGVLLDQLKQFEAALEHLAEAARLAPESVEVLTNLASTLTSLGRYDEADEILRKAHRLNAEDVNTRLGIGILHFRRGLYAQAEAELRWVCHRDDRNGQAFYYRGEALNRLERYDEAAEVLSRATELMPEDPRAFYTLGHLFDRSNRLEDAADMYRRARRLQRN